MNSARVARTSIATLTPQSASCWHSVKHRHATGVLSSRIQADKSAPCEERTPSHGYLRVSHPVRGQDGVGRTVARNKNVPAAARITVTPVTGDSGRLAEWHGWPGRERAPDGSA